MNPMIRKELQQRMRERRGWILPSLYLFVLGVIVSLVYYEEVRNAARNLQGADIGIFMFFATVYSQLAILLLLAPIFSAGSLTIEREQHTLAGLLTSLLSPGAIWQGKFVASMMFVVLLLVAGLPIVSVVFAFGGIGPWEVGMATITTLLILGTVSAVSLCLSALFKRSVHATAVSYVWVIVMTVVTFVVFLILESAYSTSASPWRGTPLVVRAPLYLNPIFFLTLSFVSNVRQLYPDWVSCFALFALISAVSVFVTMRSLRRSGETA